MSNMENRKRRSFTPEFKAEAVKLVRESGKTVTAIARELDLTVSALRSWVHQADVDTGKGPAGARSTSEKDELAELRKEVRTLRMEREFLKKAATGSTGRRNTADYPIPRREIPKRLPRSGIEAYRDQVELALGVAG